MENGHIAFQHGNGYLDRASAMDAEEFFEARNDDRRGRWRWPENPDLVVYPNHGGGQVSVIDERDGSHAHYSRRLCDSTPPPRLENGLHAAAHAYFDAHPEQKLWHDAKEGEIWDLDGAQYLAVIDTDGETVVGPRFFRLPLVAPSGSDWMPARFPHEFSNGAKAYPGSAS